MLKATAAATLSLAASPPGVHGAEEKAKLPPVQQITRGPKFHWFGYYDKLQFDPTGRYVSFNAAPRAWIQRGRSDVYVVEI